MWLLKTTPEAVAVEAEGLDEPPVCITQHLAFSAVCLNQGVFQTWHGMAWHQYKQQYADAQTEEAYSLQAAGKVGLGTSGEAKKSSSAICALLHSGTLSTPRI